LDAKIDPQGVNIASDFTVKALLPRHADRIWRECGHWLNLSGEWVPVASLEYALTMHTLTEYSHLHEWVRQKTADLRRLPSELSESRPFIILPRLASHIEERLGQKSLLERKLVDQHWLQRLGEELCRFEDGDESEQQRIRTLADNLAHTKWWTTQAVEMVPYVRGVPAGIPRRAGVAWSDCELYVEPLSTAKLARLVPDRLAKAFGRPDTSAALNYCFGRLPDEVTEYVAENFTLCPRLRHSIPVAERVDVHRKATSESPASAKTSGEEPRPNDSVDVPTVTVELEPDETEEEQAAIDGYEAIQRVNRHAGKSQKPAMIERFAKAFGYQKHSDDRFVHADGSWIAKTHDSAFRWQRWSAKGDLVKEYWVKDHCLEKQALELGSDVWSLMEKFPERYALILSTPEGEPLELPGARLRTMCDNRELTLHPATYRLVLNRDTAH